MKYIRSIRVLLILIFFVFIARLDLYASNADVIQHGAVTNDYGVRVEIKVVNFNYFPNKLLEADELGLSAFYHFYRYAEFNMLWNGEEYVSAPQVYGSRESSRDKFGSDPFNLRAIYGHIYGDGSEPNADYGPFMRFMRIYRDDGTYWYWYPRIVLHFENYFLPDPYFYPSISFPLPPAPPPYNGQNHITRNNFSDRIDHFVFLRNGSDYGGLSTLDMEKLLNLFRPLQSSIFFNAPFEFRGYGSWYMYNSFRYSFDFGSGVSFFYDPSGDATDDDDIFAVQAAGSGSFSIGTSPSQNNSSFDFEYKNATIYIVDPFFDMHWLFPDGGVVIIPPVEPPPIKPPLNMFDGSRVFVNDSYVDYMPLSTIDYTEISRNRSIDEPDIEIISEYLDLETFEDYPDLEFFLSEIPERVPERTETLNTFENLEDFEILENIESYIDPRFTLHPIVEITVDDFINDVILSQRFMTNYRTHHFTASELDRIRAWFIDNNYTDVMQYKLDYSFFDGNNIFHDIFAFSNLNNNDNSPFWQGASFLLDKPIDHTFSFSRWEEPYMPMWGRLGLVFRRDERYLNDSYEHIFNYIRYSPNVPIMSGQNIRQGIITDIFRYRIVDSTVEPPVEPLSDIFIDNQFIETVERMLVDIMQRQEVLQLDQQINELVQNQVNYINELQNITNEFNEIIQNITNEYVTNEFHEFITNEFNEFFNEYITEHIYNEFITNEFNEFITNEFFETIQEQIVNNFNEYIYNYFITNNNFYWPDGEWPDINWEFDSALLQAIKDAIDQTREEILSQMDESTVEITDTMNQNTESILAMLVTLINAMFDIWFEAADFFEYWFEGFGLTMLIILTVLSIGLILFSVIALWKYVYTLIYHLTA